MKPTRSRNHPDDLRSQRRTLATDLPAPRGLVAGTFSLEGDDYVVIGFPLPERRVPDGLSAAEREVVLLVCEGRSNTEIARTRETSASTVANQLNSVYTKLKISGRQELLRCCTVERAGGA
jgi:DNA-binding CsgD family transcriptional regulator